MGNKLYMMSLSLDGEHLEKDKRETWNYYQKALTLGF